LFETELLRGSEGALWKIVERDLHLSLQRRTVLDATTGEVQQRRLVHSEGEAEQFLPRSKSTVIGIEAVGTPLGASNWWRLGHYIGFAVPLRSGSAMGESRVLSCVLRSCAFQFVFRGCDETRGLSERGIVMRQVLGFLRHAH
jgi:hypothetical protein